MTINPTLTPKSTATTALLVAVGLVALASLTLQLPRPVADAGWRHDAAAEVPVTPMAATQMRARAFGGATMTPAGETSIARGRN